MSKQYDNTGKVSLWKNDKGGDKAPVLRGVAYAHRDLKAGEEIEVALWKNDKGGERSPALTGKLSDKFKPTTKDAGDSDVPRAKPDFDDDLPF